MSEVLEKLATLTGLRDRDTLDVGLAEALSGVLEPQLVEIYRRVGPPGNERWLLRARLACGDLAATSDPAWVELDSLPRCSDHPQRERAVAGRDVVLARSPAGGSLAIFPLGNDATALSIIEICTTTPLEDAGLRIVSGILRVYRNFHSLLDYSERDTLTALRNRKTFDDSFLKLIGEPPASHPEPKADGVAPTGGTWLGVIDIDHFKHVNDMHGHLIGDEVLLMLSRLMANNFRFNDHVFRFGGEEFVVLMRCTSEEQAVQAFERLRERVQAFSFPRVGQQTISIGFTQVRPADSPSGAFQRADQAVYWAKKHGRNRVCSFAELVKIGELIDKDWTSGANVELF